MSNSKNSNQDNVQTLEQVLAAIAALPESEKEALRNMQQKVSEPIVKKATKERKVAKIDPVKAEKVIETQKRLAEVQARRLIVANVLGKLYKGKQFTVSEIKDVLAPVVEEWEINPVAELNNILKNIGAQIVGNVKREAGRGRRENIWKFQ